MSFTERPDGLPDFDRLWPPERDGDRPIVVEYRHEDGRWHPWQVWTQDDDGGLDMYDCDLIRGRLYYHLAGIGGRPYVNGYTEPESLPGRIWFAPGVIVVEAGSSGRELSPADLLALGLKVIVGPTPDPLGCGVDEQTVWCPDCEGRLPLSECDGQCARCGEPVHVHPGSLIAMWPGWSDEAPSGIYRLRGELLSPLWDLRADDVAQVSGPCAWMHGYDDDPTPICRSCADGIEAAHEGTD